MSSIDLSYVHQGLKLQNKYTSQLEMAIIETHPYFQAREQKP